MREPKFRCPTASAIIHLATEFSYPYNRHMQDWEYEVSTITDVEKYFKKYTTTDDDDIRFLLMEMILETSNEDKNFDWISEIWPRAKQLLIKNFSLHEYTVYYWSSFAIEDIEDAFYISPCMRALWEESTNL